ncbi:MAG: PG0541 family transporter-associated protein [Fusobacteriota bacterium]
MYKSIRIIFDSSIEDEIKKLIRCLDIKECVEFPDLKGEWGKDQKHLGTHIWPGSDSAILIIEEEEKAKKLIERLRKYKEDLEYDVPFHVIVINVEEYI